MINPIAQKQIDYIAERCKEIKPLVVIRSLTYNHEKYLKDALEGFVMQKTDFPFIAIVHEDASTDKTAEILKEYAEKYPDIIFPIFEEENQYSKRDGSLRDIVNTASKASNAKYIALCEGDDYWIDPLKLQKQVDFLESHPDYSMCFHKVDVISLDPRIDLSIYNHLENKDYNAVEIMKKWTIPTASSIYRSFICNNIPRHPDFCVGDNVLFLTCSRFGKLYCLPETMAIYRRHKDGWIIKTGRFEGIRRMIFHDIALLETFPDLNLGFLKKKIANSFARYTFYKIKQRKFPIRFILNGLKYSKIEYLKWMIKIPILRIKNYLKNELL